MGVISDGSVPELDLCARNLNQPLLSTLDTFLHATYIKVVIVMVMEVAFCGCARSADLTNTPGRALQILRHAREWSRTES